MELIAENTLCGCFRAPLDPVLHALEASPTIAHARLATPTRFAALDRFTTTRSLSRLRIIPQPWGRV
jgi:hypothetical protein